MQNSVHSPPLKHLFGDHCRITQSMDVGSEKSVTDLFICSLLLALLKAHSLPFSFQGVRLGLQWQWSAGIGKQC